MYAVKVYFKVNLMVLIKYCKMEPSIVLGWHCLEVVLEVVCIFCLFLHSLLLINASTLTNE